MQSLKIHKSHLTGSISIPPSKSHTMRALLFAAMAKGKSRIQNYLKSPDTFAMVETLRTFGIQVEMDDHVLTIHGGKLSPAKNIIDAGNSGIVLRFIGALSALLPSYTVITGDHSVRNYRPVAPLLSALNQLGAFAVSSQGNDSAPIIIRGPLKPGLAKLSGEDSQPVSGLLIATSFLSGTTYFEVSNPGERPWIDMTISWLRRFGAKIEHTDYKYYQITGPISYEGFEEIIPGDFSSAAFPLVAAILTKSKVTLENVDLNDIQGDKQIIDIVRKMGAQIVTNPSNITIERSKVLRGIAIDANDMIDAVPILAVLGCFAEGKTEICNVGIARKKESDRIQAIVEELKKMGANIVEKKESLIVKRSFLKGAKVFSHKDHRIAMALSVAGLGCSGETIVDHVECISKSYPTFISDFQKWGASFDE